MQQFETELGNKKLIFKITDWALQASGSVLAQYGETVVLATATQGGQAREGIDYFPLLVDYDERFYAGGKIGGSRFIRREGRPSDDAILTARMIDRSLRPLFEQDERRDVQVVITVLSFDKQNDPDIPALLAASLALSLSPIVFDGPVGGIRLGWKDEKLIINPTYEEREAGTLDLVIVGKGEGITMVEAEAHEISEDQLKKIFREGASLITKLVAFQKDIIKTYSPIKHPVIKQEVPKSLVSFVEGFSKKKLKEAFFRKSDVAVKESLALLRSELLEGVRKEFNQYSISQALSLFDEALGQIMTEEVLKNSIRPDGRKSDELRPITCEIGVLPRTHGSALFLRGMTHALSVVTLGAPGDERWIDSMESEEKQRYMHHYNFPPFSVGEVSPLRGPSRRDLGHGYLAQRAIEPVLPPPDEFPYTIRVVTEILSSNGSSSMASACGSSLALMDAGVPLKRAVAGIALGLVYKSENDFAILTDIQGPEDHNGEMDFKVAGTFEGVTAIQMDTKLKGLPLAVLDAALDQGKKARLEILSVMEKIIALPRQELSHYAPRVIRLTIDPAKIRFVIGPGGETINDIIAKTAVKMDIEDDGSIFITSPDEASGQRAKEIVEQITRDFKEGDMVKGKVVSIRDFGAFIEIAPGKQGLVHVSELADQYVKNVGDVISLGQIVEARIIGIDHEGKIRLSLKKAGRLQSPPPHALSPKGPGDRKPPHHHARRNAT